MAMNKMTIFYRKKNLEINSAGIGEYDLSVYGMDIEDAQQIYGYIVLDLDRYVMQHIGDFYLEAQKDGSLQLKMRDEVKEKLQKYI